MTWRRGYAKAAAQPAIRQHGGATGGARWRRGGQRCAERLQQQAEQRPVWLRTWQPDLDSCYGAKTAA